MSGWRNTRVLVTGASGFLGSHLVYALDALGAQVIGLVPPRIDRHDLESRGLSGRMEVWTGSTRDAGMLERLLSKCEVEVCLHFASVSQLRRAAESPVETFEDNVQGTWVLLEACRRRPKLRAFVLASSDKAYGDQAGRACAEDAPLAAELPYDSSKACADIVSRTYARQYGVPAVVARFANVYGPGDLNLERLIPGTVTRLLDGRAPLIHAGAEQFMREYLFVEDAVQATLLLATVASSQAGQAFNVGAEAHSVAEVIAKLGVIVGGALPPESAPARAHAEIPQQRLDSTRLRKLGWRPSVDFETGLRRTVAWYRALHDSGRPPPLSADTPKSENPAPAR